MKVIAPAMIKAAQGCSDCREQAPSSGQIAIVIEMNRDLRSDNPGVIKAKAEFKEWCGIDDGSPDNVIQFTDCIWEDYGGQNEAMVLVENAIALGRSFEPSKPRTHYQATNFLVANLRHMRYEEVLGRLYIAAATTPASYLNNRRVIAARQIMRNFLSSSSLISSGEL